MLNTKWLKTVKNFAVNHNVTPAYIYKLVKAGRMQLVSIDGIFFVDTSVYKAIPVQLRRK